MAFRVSMTIDIDAILCGPEATLEPYSVAAVILFYVHVNWEMLTLLLYCYLLRCTVLWFIRMWCLFVETKKCDCVARLGANKRALVPSAKGKHSNKQRIIVHKARKKRHSTRNNRSLSHKKKAMTQLFCIC